MTWGPIGGGGGRRSRAIAIETTSSLVVNNERKIVVWSRRFILITAPNCKRTESKIARWQRVNTTRSAVSGIADCRNSCCTALRPRSRGESHGLPPADDR